MDLCFERKRALVTGAGKGIGKGVAIKLAELGAEVIAVSRTKNDLDELAKINPNIKPLFLDVGDWDATKAALEQLENIDMLVNNAAIVGPLTYDNLKEKELDELYNVNLKAVVNISSMIVNKMKSRGKGGAIVNVSSISSLVGEADYGVYGTSKAAVDQLTRSLAVQYGPYNIRVNSVNPTYIRTRMAEDYFEPGNEFAKSFMEKTPLRRFGEVKDVVDPIVFLLSDGASMITGVSLPIDGGVTISA